MKRHGIENPATPDPAVRCKICRNSDERAAGKVGPKDGEDRQASPQDTTADEVIGWEFAMGVLLGSTLKFDNLW